VKLEWIIGGDANKASRAILNGKNLWGLQVGGGEGGRWSFGYTPTWSTNAERVQISYY